MTKCFQETFNSNLLKDLLNSSKNLKKVEEKDIGAKSKRTVSVLLNTRLFCNWFENRVVKF